jgi:acyl-CoA thioester hydrolase
MVGDFETYRGIVYPWECDWNGHMNVRFYVGKFDEGTWQFFAELGATRAVLQARNYGAMAVSQTISYKRELMPGETILVRSTLVGLGQTSCRFRHVMIETQCGEVAAEMDLVGVFVDLASRKAVPVWPELRARCEALLAATAEARVA